MLVTADRMQLRLILIRNAFEEAEGVLAAYQERSSAMLVPSVN